MEQLRLPIIDKSCCGCSLETGSKIIAYIHLIPILSLGILAFVATIIDDYRYFKATGHDHLDSFTLVFFRDQFELAITFMNFTFSGLLLYGIYKKYPLLLEPFIVMKGTIVLMKMINVLVFFIERTKGTRSMKLFFHIVTGCLHSYMFVLIHNYRRQLMSMRSETDLQ